MDTVLGAYYLLNRFFILLLDDVLCVLICFNCTTFLLLIFIFSPLYGLWCSRLCSLLGWNSMISHTISVLYYLLIFLCIQGSQREILAMLHIVSQVHELQTLPSAPMANCLCALIMINMINFNIINNIHEFRHWM